MSTKPISDRLNIVRNAVAEAAKGLEGAEYREFFGELLADAEGWRMELEEMEEDEAES